MRNILVLTMLFSMNTQAIDLILGGLSHHIGQKRYPDKGRRIRYNSNHRMRGLGFKYGEYYISVIRFTNSYYDKGEAISVQYRNKSLYFGGTVSTGYDKWGQSNVGPLALAPSVTYKTEYVAFSLMGNVAVMSFNIPISNL